MLSRGALRARRFKARARWGFVVFLFCLAYASFTLAFVTIRLWLWGSARFWAALLRIGDRVAGTPYEKLLPQAVRDPAERERLKRLIEEHQELLRRYGWLP